jgi:tRNA nucleotidyltransferase (CCA-adding enzyme)
VTRSDDLLERAFALPGVGELAPRPGLHLVGGAVRDLLRGGTPVDLDFVIEEGDPAAVLAPLGAPVVVHERFGTATARRDGRHFDVARARAESYARPGALPDPRPAGLEEDLRRRDFTVNTFALALGAPAPGELRSVPEAAGDLAAGRLRTLHAASFADDPTRLLRLARYRGRLGFAVEAGTAAQARAAVAAGALDTVSGPRIGAELRLALVADDALDVFAALAELGVDEAIAPGFGLRGDLAERALALLPPDGRRDLTILAAAAAGVAEPAALLDRLGFRADERRVVVAGAGAGPLARRAAAARRPAELAELFAGPEQAALAGAHGPEAAARAWIEDLRHRRLAIGGEDLRAAGVPEGPALGAALRHVLARRLDGDLAPGREAELAAALEAARRVAGA